MIPSSLLRPLSSSSLRCLSSISKPRHDVEGRPPLTQFSKQEIALRDTVKRFSHNVIKPLVRSMDEESQMHPSVIKGVFDNGFMGVEVPEKYGGSQGSFFNVVTITEEMSKVDAAVALFSHAQNVVVGPMMTDLGTDDQKDKYMAKICTELVGAFALSEADSGSDAFSLQTTAKVDGDDFVINGRKLWVTNAEQAKLFYVFANADPTKGYKGITCFIVDRETPGLSIGKKENKLGIRASSTCPVNLDNVRVHKSAILGEYGKVYVLFIFRTHAVYGYKYAMSYLNAARIGVGAQMLGLAQGCFDNAVPYLQERKQFGTRIIDFQGMAFQVAEIATELEAARMLVYNAARLKDAGLPYVKQASMAKLYASTVASKTTSKCVEWMGGVGFTKEFPIEKYYRDAKIGTIYEGTSNIQKATLAKLIDQEFSS